MYLVTAVIDLLRIEDLWDRKAAELVATGRLAAGVLRVLAIGAFVTGNLLLFISHLVDEVDSLGLLLHVVDVAKELS